MAKNIILYNPLSNNGRGLETAQQAEAYLSDKTVYEDITRKRDIVKYINNASENDKLIIVGGDGTINRLANDLDGNVPDKGESG